MTLLLVGIVLPWVLVAVGGWIAYQLLRQNGRILLKLETLERRLPATAGSGAVRDAQPARPAPNSPTGLSPGSPAPGFELPDLSGRRVSLAEWRGQRLLLLFFNPQCGFCTQMAPELANLSGDPANGRPIPVVVSTGDAGQNREMVERYGIRCPFVLQERMEVAARYQVGGTPMGYLIDEQGMIASGLAVGSRALLELAESRARRDATAPPGSAGTSFGGKAHIEHKGNRSLADSRINRSGLRAGTPAPSFLLPRVGGGELGLDQYRGQRVLLVFSDPNCGPCDQLAPHLERLHRERRNLQVLMVSRGALDANKQKVAQGGMTLPVVLQRGWEISKAYGMFATPIGYLIDEEGVIASEVAVGADAILGLAGASTPAREAVAQ